MTSCLLLLASVLLTPSETEIVVAENPSEVMLYTIDEATNLLGQVLGAAVPVVTAPTEGRKHVFLGTNRWTAAAGITVADLPRDSFRVKAAGDSVYIVGRDDPSPRVSAGTLVTSRHSEYGTAIGLYDVLERHAGCRFYFPGELGTICPRQPSIGIPEGERVGKPDYTIRKSNVYAPGEQEAWYEPGLSSARRSDLARTQGRRLRMSTGGVKCGHGQNGGRFGERFGKTHPEYFCLMPDGKRWIGAAGRSAKKVDQLCQSSGIWDELYEDAKCYFLGKDPATRGLTVGSGKNRHFGWGHQASEGRYYDVMPQDGMMKCCCEKCQAAYARAANPKDWANELVWSGTASVARRLKAEDIPGTVVQMAYASYKDVTPVELPDNVMVMVAQRGPWEEPELQERHTRETVHGWAEKTRRKVWLWTYVGKYGDLAHAPDLPASTPRAMGRYWKGISDVVFGGYSESDTDRWITHYLDLYVFHKVCWDNSTDVEALLAEHDRLMFGAAAKPMGEIFRIFEAAWLRFAGKTVETDLGPMGVIPSDDIIWTRLYGPKVVARLDALFAAAEKSVAAGGLEARRIALVRREFYEKWRAKSVAYNEIADEPKWRRYHAEHPELRRLTAFEKSGTRDGTVTVADGGRRFTVATGPKDSFVNAVTPLTGLELGRRYRLSWFRKAEGVSPIKHHAGFRMTLMVGGKMALRHPVAGTVVGTSDWVHDMIEFVATAEKTSVGFILRDATGSVTVEDVLLEPLATR